MRIKLIRVRAYDPNVLQYIELLPSTIGAVIFCTESSCYWLDSKIRSEGDRDYTWADGTPLNNFFRIIHLEPGFDYSLGDCVCVYRVLQQVIAQSLNCSAASKFICQESNTLNYSDRYTLHFKASIAAAIAQWLAIDKLLILELAIRHRDLAKDTLRLFLIEAKQSTCRGGLAKRKTCR